MLPNQANQFYAFGPAVNKGNQATGGPAGAILGDISVPLGTCDDSATSPYYTKAFVNFTVAPPTPWVPPTPGGAPPVPPPPAPRPYTILSSSNGGLWLMVGTDSGYEGMSVVYYKKITAYMYLVNGSSSGSGGLSSRRILSKAGHARPGRRL